MHIPYVLACSQAGASFDALFDSVPAGELEQAMKEGRKEGSGIVRLFEVV